jgi:hypothetical protein
MKHIFTRYLLTALFLGMSWLPGKAQITLVRDVVASLGSSGAAGQFVFDYTVGEPVVLTFSSNDLLLSQGFQQPQALLPYVPGSPTILDYMVFPNPAVTTVKISFTLQTDASVTLLLVNTLGQVLFKDLRTYGAGKIVMPLQVDKLAAGIYTVVFKVDSQVYTEKLIVQ